MNRKPELSTSSVGRRADTLSSSSEGRMSQAVDSKAVRSFGHLKLVRSYILTNL